MIITLAGEIGAGKSTIAKRLAPILGFDYFSTGAIMRDRATKRGMDIDRYNTRLESDPRRDRAFDEHVAKRLVVNGDTVMDSWMAWHTIGLFQPKAPPVIRGYLIIDPWEAAKRIYANQRPEEIAYRSVEETFEHIQARDTRLVKRYHNVYNVNITDPHNYDFMVNVTPKGREALSIDAVTDAVLANVAIIRAQK